MVPTDPSKPDDGSVVETLFSLLSRLEDLSREPDFTGQREHALAFFLQPYALRGEQFPIQPLAEEWELAKLALYADFLPLDGQPSLIEQARDQILHHLPEEERVWLDPLRHSYMDILELTSIGSPGPDHVCLRSLGDGVEYVVPNPSHNSQYQPGWILLTRLIRRQEYTVFPGIAVVMSHAQGLAVFEIIKDIQRKMEVTAGAFELGEWPAFAKEYGHMLMWALADHRLQTLVEGETKLNYVSGSGDTFLYALALYEHNEFHHFTDTFHRLEGFTFQTPEGTGGSASSKTDVTPPPNTAEERQVWIQYEQESPSTHQGPIVAKLTLTPTQLLVECDSPDRLNDVKHELAAHLGFALHFKGETTERPAHFPKEIDLLAEAVPTNTVEVSKEEEYRLLSHFLEAVYLDWAEKPSPALNGQTPRHFVTSTGNRERVATLIDERERGDPALLRTGKPGFDYNMLREHVGL